ncbi:MAG: sigma-70 family RNA polymerase sigma factor [Gemmatimonadaceae bacterium]
MRFEVATHTSLVQSMASGDQRAATRLYDECSPILYALALRIVGDTTDAEEVVLAVFMQAWNGASAYQEGRSSVLSWLSMITRTRALDLVRARVRRVRAVARAVTVMGDEPIAISASMVIVSDKIENDERAREVTLALQKLPTTQRAAIELAYFTGLTHTEIANRLGEPLGTVKTRIRLAVQHLRDMLSGTLLTPGVS